MSLYCGAPSAPITSSLFHNAIAQLDIPHLLHEVSLPPQTKPTLKRPHLFCCISSFLFVFLCQNLSLWTSITRYPLCAHNCALYISRYISATQQSWVLSKPPRMLACIILGSGVWHGTSEYVPSSWNTQEISLWFFPCLKSGRMCIKSYAIQRCRLSG